MRMENDCDVKLTRHIRIIIYVILTEMNPFNDSNIDNSYDLDKRMFCQSDDYYLCAVSIRSIN